MGTLVIFANNVAGAVVGTWIGTMVGAHKFGGDGPKTWHSVLACLSLAWLLTALSMAITQASG